MLSCVPRFIGLEGMDFQASFVGESLLEQKLLDVLAPVSLKLDNLSGLFVIDDSSIATPALHKLSVYPLKVQLGVETLHCCHGLAAVALLNANVDVTTTESGVCRVCIGHNTKFSLGMNAGFRKQSCKSKEPEKRKTMKN